MVGSEPHPQSVKAMEVINGDSGFSEMKDESIGTLKRQPSFVPLQDQVEDLKQSLQYMNRKNHEEMMGMSLEHKQQMESMQAEIARLKRNQNSGSRSGSKSVPLLGSHTEEALSDSALAKNELGT